MKRFAFAAAAAVLFTGVGWADDPIVSPACGLVTKDEAAAIFGHSVQVVDGGAATMGVSGCSWVDEETFNAVGLNVLEGEALVGQDPATVFDATKETMASQGTFEDLADVGDKASLQAQPGEMNLLLLMLKSGKIVTLSGTGVPKDGMVTFGKTIAGRM